MLSTNVTSSDIIRPAFFIITGFSDIPYAHYYHAFLFLCYALAIMGNLFVMTIICIVRSLHTPKYLAILNLALCDLGESTALIPNIIETLSLTSHTMSYEACLANMFFVLFFFLMQSLTLSLLAYDRFVAICFPLRYHSILTNTSMGIMVTTVWLINLTIMILLVSLITRLSFCNSIVVDSFFCDHGPVFTLACNDNSLNDMVSSVVVVLVYFLPITLICLSYVSILLALFKIATWEERKKALKTCFAHLILVCVFYIPIMTIDMATYGTPVHRNVRVIGTSLSCIFPPVLNPIVYSLNTAEIREFVKKLFKRNRHKDIIPTISK